MRSPSRAVPEQPTRRIGVLLGALVVIVAAIPLFLGFLVAIPIFILTMYTSYADLFAEEADQ